MHEAGRITGATRTTARFSRRVSFPVRKDRSSAMSLPLTQTLAITETTPRFRSVIR
jgi:hypothetical protein